VTSIDPLVFLGTPEVATVPLRALVAAGHDIRLVVTGPDRRRGRGSSTSPSPVAACARDLGLPVAHEVDAVLDTGAALGIVVAYGRIIRPHVLERIPMVNIHFSLLPRWRGAAPVERAILAGDRTTGVCIMDVAEGLDEGGVRARAAIEIGTATAAELRDRLATLGTELLLSELAAGLHPPVAQSGEVTYAHKITPADLRIDWSAPADVAHRVVRVGGAWATWRGDRIRIVAADVVEGRLLPSIVQPAGRGPMPFDDWRRGARPEPGEWFG
jgi:methionyl-tRNA formyltransferase